MSEISTTIRVNDGFSRAFKAMNSALDTVMRSLSDAQKQLGKPFDMTAFNSARKELARVNTALDSMGREAREAASGQNALNSSMRNSASGANALWGKLKGLAATYASFQGAKSAINAADTYAGITSRLNLMNDGLTSTAQLEEMIRQSADRTRSSFQDSADMVGKLGVQAKAAFNNSSDVVNFVEQLNKHLIISGTNAQAASGGLLQMTQAMGAGVLRGEELNSIMESMPTVAKTIEKYFNEVLGDNRAIKKIAEDGKISAKIVKDALYWAADDINKQFEGMQATFGNLWTLFKNRANKALTPVFKRLTELSNGEKFKSFAIAAGNAVGLVGKAAVKVLDIIKGLYNFIASNWSLVQPVLIGVAAGFLAMGGAALWAKAQIVAHTIAMVISKAAMIAATFTTQGLTAAFKALAVAMSINPFMLVVYAIIAVIAAFYLAVAAVNHFTGSTISATGIIAGAVMWLAGVIWDVIVFVWNGVLAVLDGILNPCITVCELVYNAFNDGFTGWIGGVKTALWTFVNWALQLIKPLITVWDKIKGTNYAESLQSTVNDKIAAGKTSSYKTFDRNILSDKFSLEYANPSEMYKKGYKWGEGVGNKVSDFLSADNLTKQISDSLGLDSLKELADTGAGAVTGKDAINNATNPTLRGDGGYGSALDKIADNTGKLVDASEKDRQLELMRELGEREAVNRFTTAQIRVMQTNNNNIAKGADENTIMARLYQGLRDAVSRTAEGAHF